jgi:ATP-dependent RNA helicase DDX6/DHH1
MQQEVVDNLSRDLEELVQKRRSAQQHLQKCKQSLMNHGEQERELQVESQKAEDVVQELREEIDLGSMNDGQLNALQSSLDEAAEEKRLNEESYKDAVNALDEAVQKLKVLKRELAGKDAAVKAAEAALRGLQEDENRLSVQRRKALGDKNIAIGRVEEAKKQKVEVERQRQEVSLRIEDFSEKASMVSPRVRINAGENMSRLEKKLAKFTQDRDRYRQE